MLRILKKPQNYIFMFVMPLVFTLIFGGLLSGDSSKPVLAVVDHDHSTVSINFAHDIQKNTSVQLKVVSGQVAEQLYEDKKVSGIIKIQRGFQNQLINGKKPVIQIEHGPDLETTLIKEALDNTVDQMYIETTGAKIESKLSPQTSWSKVFQSIDQEVQGTPPIVQVASVTKNKSQVEMGNMSARSAGFSILFVMIMMTSATGTILEAKKMGVWYRLMATPTRRFQTISGYFLSFFLTGWVQFGVLIAATSWFFHVHWGNIGALIVLVSSLLLAVVGLGLFIAGFVKTTEQQAAFGNLIIASTCMLGGVYWPLDVVPKSMQRLAEFVPQKWAMDGFTEIMARGGTLSDIFIPVVVLLGFSIFFIGAGLSRIKYEG